MDVGGVGECPERIENVGVCISLSLSEKTGVSEVVRVDVAASPSSARHRRPPLRDWAGGGGGGLGTAISRMAVNGHQLMVLY